MSLTVKIAGGLVAIALAALVVPGYLLVVGVQDRTAELEVLERDELRAALDRRYREVEQQVRQTVSRLARELSRDEDLLERALRGGDAVADVAPDLMARSGLDLLWLLDPSGTILSAGHWPARAGGRQERLLIRAMGHAAVSRQRVRNESWLALLVAEGVPAGDHMLVLSGGTRLERIVREWSGAEGALAVALIGPDGGLLASRPWPFPIDPLPAALVDRMAAGEPVTGETTGADGAAWLLAALPLLGDGVPQGSLVAVRTLAPLRAWQRRLFGSLATVAVAAALLAALTGAVLARRITRPIQELTEVTARMAGGDLDLSLPVRSRDEVGQLTASFNAMAGSLRAGRRELARSERLAAWRDAARRMAHEVKNPLAPIRMAVENLRRARETSPESFDRFFEEECRAIIEEVDALRRLVDEFSRFARLPEPQRRPTHPGELVRHVSELYASSLDGVRIDCQVEPDLPRLELDPDLMGQVLKNLVANALDAVPCPGGRVVLECRRQGDELVLAVRDNGPGIPQAIRERLFEPQVTTKTTGSGLGLAVSRQIVERHGGRIEVETEEGRTVFEVILPVTGQPMAANPHTT